MFDEAGKVELDYTMHWTQKDPAAAISESDWEGTIRRAVLHAKKLAETDA